MKNYIKIDNISYSYPGCSFQAVKNVSLSVSEGEMLLITGGNGSGKSTLMKLIMKAVKPQVGSIYIEGKNIKKYSVSDIGRKIGFVFQNPNSMIFNVSVFDEMAFGLRQLGLSEDEIQKSADYYLKLFGLYEFRDKNPFKLSDGQKQLLAISAVLAMKSRFIILDEPTTGIDRTNKKLLIKLLKTINSEGVGIIIISHDNHLINDLNCKEIFMAKGEFCENY
jgi:energy-coupling factor transport system ATP-binding protein